MIGVGSGNPKWSNLGAAQTIIHRLCCPSGCGVSGTAETLRSQTGQEINETLRSQIVQWVNEAHWSERDQWINEILWFETGQGMIFNRSENEWMKHSDLKQFRKWMNETLWS